LTIAKQNFLCFKAAVRSDRAWLLHTENVTVAKATNHSRLVSDNSERA